MLILFLVLTSAIAQKEFVTSVIYFECLAMLCVSFADKVSLSLVAFDKVGTHRWFTSCLIDTTLIALLSIVFRESQSVFFFLGLVNILLAGLIFTTEALLMLCLLACIFYSLSQAALLNLTQSQYLFSLAVGNMTFLIVGAFSTFVASQIEFKSLLLQSTEDLQAQVFSAMPLGLLALDSQGQVVRSNLFTQSFFQSDLMGQNINQIFGDYFNQQQAFKRDFYVDVQGEKKVLDVQVAPFVSNDEKFRLVLFENVTHLRMLEDRARQSEKLAAIGGLAAGIAHEIRNPLAGISGSIQLLTQAAQTEDDQKLMRIILKEIDRLNNLITEFLDYARPASAPNEKINLSQVVEECIQQVQNSGTAEVQKTSWNTQVSKEVYILGFPDKLKQVFLNLILNSIQALDFSREAKIEVSLQKNTEAVIFTLKDSGTGMTEETRKRLFEPFYTTKAKGTGLGLAVTYKILENHRGTVQVESELGRGTKFQIEFPS